MSPRQWPDRRWAGYALIIAGLVSAMTGVALRLSDHSATVSEPSVPQVVHTFGPMIRPAPSPTGPAPHPTGESPGVPTSITLRQGASAAVVAVGIQADRSLMLPSAELVGWWIGGRQPGYPTGTTVLAGHLDDDQGRLGALATIGSLRRDAPIIVRTMTGTVQYHVVSVQTYSKTQLPRSLFAAAGPPRLVLITCGGDYTPGQGYADNVVVTAQPAAGT
jgi:hypothetical protein